MRFAAPAGVAAACLACLTAAARPARASGFASAEFGGEHGNVVTTDPTALYFNPAGMAFSDGTNLYLGGVLALRRGSWLHAQAASETADPPGAEGADVGEARFSNVFGAPALGATTRVRQLALGAALYVPLGGRLHWDQNPRFAGDASFPLAADGVQRWTLTEGALTYLYFTAGAALRLGRLAVGLTGNVVRSAVTVAQAKSSNPAAEVDPQSEYRIKVDVSGTEVSAGVGAMLEAVEGRLWLGLSYQTQPAFGAMQLHGTLDRILAGQSVSTAITYTQALPDIVRVGARLRAGRAVEVRVYGDLTRWSRLQTECLSIEGQPCAVFTSGADATPGATTVQNIRRFWKDSYGAHAGASYWATPAVELFAGAGFETAATPDSTLDTALPDAASIRVALGGRVALARGLFVSAGLTDVQFLSRDNTGRSTLADAELPTRRADAGGKYTLWLGLFHLAFEKQL